MPRTFLPFFGFMLLGLGMGGGSLGVIGIIGSLIPNPLHLDMALIATAIGLAMACIGWFIILFSHSGYVHTKSVQRIIGGWIYLGLAGGASFCQFFISPSSDAISLWNPGHVIMGLLTLLLLALSLSCFFEHDQSRAPML